MDEGQFGCVWRTSPLQREGQKPSLAVFRGAFGSTLSDVCCKLPEPYLTARHFGGPFLGETRFTARNNSKCIQAACAQNPMCFNSMQPEQHIYQKGQGMTGYSRVYESVQFNAAYGSAMHGKCLMREDGLG